MPPVRQNITVVNYKEHHSQL